MKSFDKEMTNHTIIPTLTFALLLLPLPPRYEKLLRSIDKEMKYAEETDEVQMISYMIMSTPQVTATTLFDSRPF